MRMSTRCSALGSLGMKDKRSTSHGRINLVPKKLDVIIFKSQNLM
jgi:hypothetical protein